MIFHTHRDVVLLLSFLFDLTKVRVLNTLYLLLVLGMLSPLFS